MPLAAPIRPITLGQTLRRVEVPGFVLTEDEHAPAASLPMHVHAPASLQVVLAGDFTEMLAGRPEHCERFGVIVKPPAEPHADRYGRAGARCLQIEVKPQRLASIRALSNVFDRPRHLRDDRLAALVERLYREFRATGGASELSVEGLVYELLAQATRSNARLSASGFSPAAPDWLESAIDFIHERYRASIGLREVSAQAGVHPSHFAKMFRRHQRATVGEYVRRLRIEEAQRALATSDLSLADIALAVGFYDQSHFTQAFKLQTGTTPARFRARVRRAGATSTSDEEGR